MNYLRFSEGLNNYKLIPETENIQDLISDRNKDYYVSIFKYNQDHYEHWKKTNSVAGIKDVTTNGLVFDFDDKDNVEKARQDAITAVSRLTQHGVPQEAIAVAYSGQKGFSVEVKTDKTFSVDEFKTLTKSLAGDLETYDTVVNDPQRIFRVVGTKHNKTNLYKAPLTVDNLVDWDVDTIKDYASDLDKLDASIMDNWGTVNLPDSIYNLKNKKEEVVVPFKDAVEGELDLSLKPRWLTPAKYAIQEGFFIEGERSTALTMLAATYRNQGINKEIAYRMLKGVAEVQAQRNKCDRFPDTEIYNNIISQVYGPNWKGGQYSYENSPLLQAVTKRMKLPVPNEPEERPLLFNDLGGASFIRYAKSFFETRIYTGLDNLDKAFPICAGSNVAIVGAASSGKTAMALSILKNMKKTEAVSVFASLDMAKSRLYEKLLYNVTQGKIDRETLYQEYIKGNGKKYDEMVKEEFPNVFIYSKSSPSTENLKEYIQQVQDHTGKPVRLLMIDYFERLSSQKSDDTAASKDVASGIQDLISDFPELTPITLYQPNKFSLGGGPDKPIMNYTAIKGSSFVFQAARQILSLWRPFFTPEFKDYDKFMEMAILKNDLGELDKFLYSWKGKTGEIHMTSDEDVQEYKEYMREKEQANSTEKDNF